VVADPAQRFGQGVGGKLSRAPGGVALVSAHDLRGEKGARGEHHCAPGVGAPGVHPHPAHAITLDQHLFDPCLLEVQVGCRLQGVFHPQRVAALVGLGAQRLYRGPFGHVEQADLDEIGVDRAPHLPAQGVDLAHEVALARAAHAGIARHLGNQVQVHRQQQRARSHARRSEGRLASGVPGADDDHVIGPIRHHMDLICS